MDSHVHSLHTVHRVLPGVTFHIFPAGYWSVRTNYYENIETHLSLYLRWTAEDERFKPPLPRVPPLCLVSLLIWYWCLSYWNVVHRHNFRCFVFYEWAEHGGQAVQGKSVMVNIEGCSSKNDILSDVEFLIIKNTIIIMYGPLILNISGAIGNIQVWTQNYVIASAAILLKGGHRRVFCALHMTALVKLSSART